MRVSRGRYLHRPQTRNENSVPSGTSAQETAFPETMPNDQTSESSYAPIIGAAAIHIWAELPADIQQKLFEHAVVIGHRAERDESLREQLAKFLHDHHARTQRES